MSYRNVYGGECYLRIDYQENNRLYRGDKFVNGELVGSADGDDNWELFFTRFTMLGVATNERCKFEYVEDVLASASAEG